MRLGGKGKQPQKPGSASSADTAERFLLEEARLKALKVLGSIDLNRELLFSGFIARDGKNLKVTIPRRELRISDFRPGDPVLVYIVKICGEESDGGA